MTEISDVLRRIDTLERKVDDLEERVSNQDVVDAEIKGDIKTLRVEFTNLKADIMKQISTFTTNTWKLIFVLVALVAVLVGIKELPGIW